MKINPKDNDIIMCLNWNFKKRSDIEIWSIDRVLIRGNFHRKRIKKCAPETGSRPLFNFSKLGEI